jgi:hypothetical protein
MNYIYHSISSFFILCLITSCTYASTAEIKKCLEYTTTKSNISNKNEIFFCLQLLQKNGIKNELLAQSEGTFDRKRKNAVITKLYVYHQHRKFGLGSTLLKTTLCHIATFNPKHIQWEAQWLDNKWDKQNQIKLVNFYKRHGAVAIKQHEFHTNMEYPVLLAHILQILHPAFLKQAQSALPYCSQNDPFSIIAEYLNAPLKYVANEPQ